MTMMYSPKGGWNNACGVEVDELRKLGWVAEGEEGYVSHRAALLKPKPDAEPLPKTEWKEPDIEELRKQWEAKHGKKPHHKKTVKTLLAEI